MKLALLSILCALSVVAQSTQSPQPAQSVPDTPYERPHYSRDGDGKMKVDGTTKDNPPAPPAEPEFVNQFFTLDEKGALHPLVTEPWTNFERKTGSLLSTETTIFSTYQGEHSPLRFPKGDLVIVVRVQTRDIDPKTWLHFLPLDVTKGHREKALIERTRKGNVPLYEKEAIPVSLAKYGAHSWKITPLSALGPGEYAISTLYARESWTFGVDGTN